MLMQTTLWQMPIYINGLLLKLTLVLFFHRGGDVCLLSSFLSFMTYVIYIMCKTYIHIESIPFSRVAPPSSAFYVCFSCYTNHIGQVICLTPLEQSELFEHVASVLVFIQILPPPSPPSFLLNFLSSSSSFCSSFFVPITSPSA